MVQMAKKAREQPKPGDHGRVPGRNLYDADESHMDGTGQGSAAYPDLEFEQHTFSFDEKDDRKPGDKEVADRVVDELLQAMTVLRSIYTSGCPDICAGAIRRIWSLQLPAVSCWHVGKGGTP